MKTKLFPLLALIFCMSALFFPVTAYAATDTTPPSVSARLEGDILQIEASDKGSGVEAVYVNGHRFGYLVDGAIEIELKDYAGDGEYITVYAVDFAGNKSDEAKLKNPYYTAPAATPAPSGTTPKPTPTQPAPPASGSQSQGGSTSQPSSSSSTPAPSASSEPTSTSEPGASASAIPDDDSEANPFTPDGTGTVQDNATEQDSKEFFTIVTEDENVFYLIIDRQRDNENVYLLNTVTEDDLMALAEKSSSGSGISAIPEPEPVQPAPQPEPEPEPEPEPPAKENGGSGTFIFIVLAALAVGGAGYYFKILKPKHDASMNMDDDDYEDEDEYDDGYEDLDEDDDYGDSDFSGMDDVTDYEFEREEAHDESGGEV